MNLEYPLTEAVHTAALAEAERLLGESTNSAFLSPEAAALLAAAQLAMLTAISLRLDMIHDALVHTQGTQA